MGLHRPFKPPKSPTTVVDPAPPVFNKHEDLHKGHKPGQGHHHHQQDGKGNPRKPSNSGTGSNSSNSRNHSNQGSMSNNDKGTKRAPSPSAAASTSTTPNGVPQKPSRSSSGTSTASTDLWIASANAAAAAKHGGGGGGGRSQGNGTGSNGGGGLPQSSDHSADSAQSYSQNSIDSYYEEEVLDVVDDGMNGGDGATNASSEELNLFPERNPTIRFDEYDEMQTVLHINDYTKHEISRSWYKRSDYDKMVQLARKTAEKAEQRKKELEQDEQDELRRQLEEQEDEDDQEEARQAGATSGPIPGSSQRSYGQSAASVGSHNTRSSRGTSRGGVSIVSDDGSYRTTEDEDDEFNHDGERSSSKHSRRSNGASSKRDKSSRAGSKDSSTKEDAGKAKEKKKPIEYRGLEAWTASGAAKVKLLKESSIELVWNEQSNQWDNGLFDPDRIRDVYVAVSETALQAAYDRGKNDAIIVQKLLEMDRLAAEKKKRRKLLGKSKALVKKSVKLTGKGVQQTGKLMKKTTKVTTKVAKEATKRSLKAGVATATLDPRMMKEALKVSKKRECKHELIRTPSQASGTGSGSLRDENDISTSTLDVAEAESRPQKTPFEHADSSMTDATPPEVPREALHKTSTKSSTKTKLKLLGVVPIPGTKKTWYKEDRRDKKAEKRIQKQKTRPSWEVGTSDGKY